MNAMLASTLPLPAILDRPSIHGPGRRHCIDDFDVSATAVDRFNALLARLGRRAAPLDSDRIVTAARELRDTTYGAVEPSCIQQRIKRLEAAARMIGDPQWESVDSAGSTAALIVDYANGHYQLLPNSLPKVGRLDDALAVDAAWPTLAQEVAAFMDFSRVRSLEAALRGCDIGDFSFTRRDWIEARRAEAELARQRRCIREGSYLPAMQPLFVVH